MSGNRNLAALHRVSDQLSNEQATLLANVLIGVLSVQVDPVMWDEALAIATTVSGPS